MNLTINLNLFAKLCNMRLFENLSIYRRLFERFSFPILCYLFIYFYEKINVKIYLISFLAVLKYSIRYENTLLDSYFLIIVSASLEHTSNLSLP